MKAPKLIITVLIALLSHTGCIYDHDPEGEEDLKAGDLLPYFEITMNDGRKLTTDSLRGRPSAIIFFNTDCADCRKELPVIEELYLRKGEDVTVVCISREEDAQDIGNYWAISGLSIPYSAQDDRIIYNMFAHSGIPRVYISDSDLKITSIFTDYPLPTLRELEDALADASL